MPVKEFVDKHPAQAPLITVNSWNEWTETTPAPRTMYVYGYLEAVKTGIWQMMSAIDG